MIDNPLPNQIMQQKDAEARSSIDQEHCYIKAKEICEEHAVHKDLIHIFQLYYHDCCLDPQKENPEEVLNTRDIIDEWWDDYGDDYDDYISPYEDFDPTPDYLYGNSGEPPISAEERNRMAFDSKRESHCRGNPFGFDPINW